MTSVHLTKDGSVTPAELPRLVVRGAGPTLARLEVLLDGRPVPGLLRLEFEARLLDVTTVRLEVAVGALEIDAELLAVLVARMGDNPGATITLEPEDLP